MKKSLFEEMGGTYRQIGDYLIPNLTLPPEARKPIGIWGQMHKDYLRQYKKIAFYVMLTNGILWSYLTDINTQAEEMFSRLVNEMAEQEGVDKKLKEENQMEWVRKMANIKQSAREVVYSYLIYI